MQIIMKKYIYFFILSILVSSCMQTRYDSVLIKDDFSELDTGLFSANVAAHIEYHYLSEAGSKGNWVVSCFGTGRQMPGWGSAWQVKNIDLQNTMCQTYANRSSRTHPMIIAGDSLWQNYKLIVQYQPESDSLYSGIAFRYRNDRSFYFFGIKNSKVYISKFIGRSKDLNLNEKILVEHPRSEERRVG